MKTPPPGLHDFYHVRNAEAQLKIDQPGKRLSILKSWLNQSLWAPNFSLTSACKSPFEENKAARQTLLKVLGSGRSTDKAQALFGLAKLELDEKNHAQAFKYLKRLDIEFYLIGFGAERPSYQKSQSNPKTYRKRWANGAKDIITSAEKLLKAHRNKAVVKALEKLPKRLTDARLNCRKLFALGKALRKLRKWQRARPILDKRSRSVDESITSSHRGPYISQERPLSD